MHRTLHGKQVFQMKNTALTYYDLKAQYISAYQTFDKIQLVTVFSGTVEYSFDLEEVSQTNMSMLILPPYSRFHIHAAGQARMMVLEIKESLLKSIAKNVQMIRLPSEPNSRLKPYTEIRLNSSIYSSIQAIHSEYVQHNHDPYLVELDVCRLIYTLMQTEYARYLFPLTASHPMDQVKYYINRNIKESIKVGSLAALVGMNSSNFTNTFKRHFGKTPQDYIQTHKMACAEKLLKDHMVTDAAFEVGYENVSTFIAHFKKVYHMTPKQYQLYHQNPDTRQALSS